MTQPRVSHKNTYPSPGQRIWHTAEIQRNTERHVFSIKSFCVNSITLSKLFIESVIGFREIYYELMILSFFLLHGFHGMFYFIFLFYDILEYFSKNTSDEWHVIHVNGTCWPGIHFSLHEFSILRHRPAFNMCYLLLRKCFFILKVHE